MWFRRGLPVLVFAFSWCLPSHAANLFTVNNSDGQGISGGLLATPPGTCTGVPGGLPGHCEFRASAAVQAWATGQFGSGTEWSDATDPSVPLPAGTQIIRVDGSTQVITSADLINNVNTKIGASWIPEVCNRPWCGNLLRGDVIAFLDENGDGVWNDTWIDDGDNIREAGEVDRTRAEQFAWGITSVMRNLSDLSLAVGNVSPPGISRMRPRIALGDASQNPSAGCDGDIMNPECHNAVVTPPDLTNSTPTMIDDDAAVFGRCDPDRPEFTSLIAISPVRAQKALDNCLWFFASFPVTAPSPGSFDALQNQLRPDGQGVDPLPPSEGGDDGGAVRDAWLDQVVVKYVAANIPEQVFSQNFMVRYGFRAAPDTSDVGEAIYENEWRLTQSDQDFGTGLTYPYNFLMQHTADSRRRGFTQDPSVPISECLPPLADPACDGQTNPTVDPFWGQAIVRDLSGNPVLDSEGAFTLNFDQDFEWFPGADCNAACRESGVGQEQEFTFLYEQFVESGFLLSCLNCGHPAPLPMGTVTYSFSWPGLPTITPVTHPPTTTELPVLP